MSNPHRLTYVDMHPEAVGREKAPHPIALIAGGIAAAVAGYATIVFLFTL